MCSKFSIKAFEGLPADLKPSDYVDMLLFLGLCKPVVRLGQNNFMLYRKMNAWCKKYSFKSYVSRAGYMYISKKMFLSYFASIVDDLPFPHEYLLGNLLGYPKCCVKKISTLGESNIDKWESLEFGDDRLVGKYKLIDPKLYRKGTALVSHVPCCNTCAESLHLAKAAQRIVITYRNYECMQRWAWAFNQ